jgi:circadian clock protein KaiB
MTVPTSLRIRAKKAGKSAIAAEQYVLTLYITGLTPRSIQAISNIRTICEKHLKGRHDLQIVDIAQHPALAEGEQIIAAPTLVKTLPLPLRRFIGDLSQTDRLLNGLDLTEPAERDSPDNIG